MNRIVWYTLERDQRDFIISADAQPLQHVHQFAVRHATIGAQENAAVLASVRNGIQRTDEIDAFDRGLAYGDGKVGLGS